MELEGAGGVGGEHAAYAYRRAPKGGRELTPHIVAAVGILRGERGEDVVGGRHGGRHGRGLSSLSSVSAAEFFG